ncbi:efflux RND transporter periplasmic adaptor subunit [Micavibrio aeruginosavorus]|uniref:efflux RND transporter periplasmic adaptor subunit n=1 Tax=Micavibrio aeruginosavorus TaxID=349221 RepID=UPI003F4ABD59
MVKRFIIVLILVGILFAGLIGYDIFKKKMMGQFLAMMSQQPPAPVVVVTAETKPVSRTLEGIGTLQAVRQVTVSPEVGGRVTNITFEAGVLVAAGDLLVQLNDEPDKGDLTRFQAQAKLAQQNLTRSSKLVDVASTRSTVDRDRAELNEAEGGIARTEAVIRQKQIRAPFDGVLGIRQVNLGQYLNPGDTIVTLTDLSELFVNFTLPEQTLADIAVGQEVELRVDAYPADVFIAKINAIEPQVGDETRTVEVQAILANEDGKLKPGMFARSTVILPDGADQVILPETAVDFTIYGDSVYIVTEGKNEAGEPTLTATRHYIKTGARFKNQVVIVDGVKAGDRVVTGGQLKLTSGGAVTIAPKDALAEDFEKKKDSGKQE